MLESLKARGLFIFLKNPFYKEEKTVLQKACRIANAVTQGDMHKLTCRQAVRNSKRCQLPQENGFAS